MKDPILAEKKLYAISEDGDGIEICIKIYLPCKTNNDDRACKVDIQGLKDKAVWLFGFESWQALTLALGWVHKDLLLFTNNGGLLFWEKHGNPIDMSDLFSSGLLNGIE